MFGGSMVAVVTPMTAAGAIDLAAWDRLLRFHAEQGTDGLIVGGTTGESPALSTAELSALIEAAVRRLRGRMPVIAGTGTNVTASSVERARTLSAMGVDALLVVTPYYNKPTQEGLYRHFHAVAEAASVPVIPYNVPARTGADLLPETVIRLSALPRIVAIKEATGNLERARLILAEASAGFEVYSGDDLTAIELMGLGAKGVISVTANVAPKLMHEVSVAAIAGQKTGDMSHARALDARLQELHRALFLESNPIPAKWALNQMGLIGPSLRLPLTPLAEQYHDTVRAAMRAADVHS
jgi:4-hydroxy-tetrahydrodipicolinate synthase